MNDNIGLRLMASVTFDEFLPNHCTFVVQYRLPLLCYGPWSPLFCVCCRNGVGVVTREAARVRCIKGSWFEVGFIQHPHSPLALFTQPRYTLYYQWLPFNTTLAASLKLTQPLARFFSVSLLMEPTHHGGLSNLQAITFRGQPVVM